MAKSSSCEQLIMFLQILCRFSFVEIQLLFTFIHIHTHYSIIHLHANVGCAMLFVLVYCLFCCCSWKTGLMAQRFGCSGKQYMHAHQPLHAPRNTSRITHHAIRFTAHVTHCTSCITSRSSHVTRHTPILLSSDAARRRWHRFHILRL